MLDLINDCAPLAVCAANQLTKHGVKNRIIRVIGKQKGQHNRHAVVMFEYDDKVRAYDCMGTRTLPKRYKLTDSPTVLAKAYGRNSDYGFPVTRGEKF